MSAVAADTISRRSAGLVGFVERYRKIAALPPPGLRTIRLGRFAAGGRTDRPVSGIQIHRLGTHRRTPHLTVTCDSDCSNRL